MLKWWAVALRRASRGPDPGCQSTSGISAASGARHGWCGSSAGGAAQTPTATRGPGTEHSDHVDAQAVLTRRAGAEACRQVGQEARPVSRAAAELGVCWWTVTNAEIEHGTPTAEPSSSTRSKIAEAELRSPRAKLAAAELERRATRALPRLHRRGLQMVLRLLAYNAELWLSEHLDAYLADPNEFRAIARHLLRQPGTLAYSASGVAIAIDRPDRPRVAQTAQLLTDELNATPARIPGDTRPITYRSARETVTRNRATPGGLRLARVVGAGMKRPGCRARPRRHPLLCHGSDFSRRWAPFR